METFLHEEMEKLSLKIEGAWKNARLSILTLSFSPQGYFTHEGAHLEANSQGYVIDHTSLSPMCD